MKLTAAIVAALVLAAVARSALYERTAFEKPAPPCPEPCLREKVAHWQRLAAKRLRGWNHANRQVMRWKQTAFSSASLDEAIRLASVVYHVPSSTLWRRARCESQLYRYAQNASGASGYWQFLPSTWRSTPFARFSIFSTYPQALAAAWMMGPAGRAGEWVCR
jgi:hypothetical protein